jgi:hypothetical protein
MYKMKKKQKKIIETMTKKKREKVEGKGRVEKGYASPNPGQKHIRLRAHCHSGE